MSLPTGVSTAVVRYGPYLTPAGRVCAGAVRLRLLRDVYHAPSGSTVVAMVEEYPLGASVPKDTAPLLATDTPDVGAPPQYEITVELRDPDSLAARTLGPYVVSLPASDTPQDLDVILNGAPAGPSRLAAYQLDGTGTPVLTPGADPVAYVTAEGGQPIVTVLDGQGDEPTPGPVRLTLFGVDPDEGPYYDPAGPTPGQAAYLLIENGQPALYTGAVT